MHLQILESIQAPNLAPDAMLPILVALFWAFFVFLRRLAPLRILRVCATQLRDHLKWIHIHEAQPHVLVLPFLFSQKCLERLAHWRISFCLRPKTM